MELFKGTKHKITREAKGDRVLFRIGYHKDRNALGYKAGLLKKLTGCSPCLAIVNPKFMYMDQKKRFDLEREAIFRRLEAMGIQYRKLPVQRKEEMSIFGLPMRQNEERYYQEDVTGLALESGDVDAAISSLGFYNMYYYIDCRSCCRDGLLDSCEAIFDDEEKLKKAFRYVIFDDNFVGNIVIYCDREDAEYISKELEP